MQKRDSEERLKNISRDYDNNYQSAQFWFRDKPATAFRDKPAIAFWERIYDKQLEIAMSLVHCYTFPYPENHQRKALDIGCNSGRYTKALIAEGIDGVGIDSARIPLICATEWVPQGHFLQASITHLPFKTASLDVVVCIELLHHLTDEVLERSLERIASAIKPGGIFIFDIKNKLNPLVYWAYKKVDSVNFTLRARTIGQMQRVVESKGFKVIKKRGFLPLMGCFAPYVYCCAVRRGI